MEQHPDRGALDGWQFSDDTAVVSGDWSGVGTATLDGLDFTGGDARIMQGAIRFTF